jgi:PiT family inorganic phosphate transporter
MYEAILLTILISLAFCFTNGYQDASTVAATFIASRSATPRQGILFVTLFNVIGAIFGGTAVVLTISGLLADGGGPEMIFVILAGILAATAWNIVTWWWGLPSSSTHGLIGGLIGAGMAHGGPACINWGTSALLSPSPRISGVSGVIIILVVSVLLGLAGGYAMRSCSRLVLRNAKRRVNRTFVCLNWCSTALMAFYNGANDSQKQLGIIALVLFYSGLVPGFSIPLWARILCATLLGAGTLLGGWRIMTTLGRRIFRIEPIHSFDSQVSSGAILAVSTLAGAPVSSSHIISASVIGVGAAENPKKVRWDVGRKIVTVLVLTIPATTVVSYGIASLLFSFMR